MSELQSQNIEYGATILGMALVTILALVVLFGVLRFLILHKDEPSQIFVTDKEGNFLLDIKRVKSVSVTDYAQCTNRHEDYGINICYSYKKGKTYDLTINCGSEESAKQMIIKIRELLPGVTII